MPAADALSRFSNRVADYVRSRPGYPHAVLELLEREVGFNKSMVVADIGSGTGLSSELFLKNGLYQCNPGVSHQISDRFRVGRKLILAALDKSSHAVMNRVGFKLELSFEVVHRRDVNRYVGGPADCEEAATPAYLQESAGGPDAR